MAEITTGTVYSSAFYSGQEQGSCRSANRVVPVIIELIHPTTVLDEGCGLGTWLAEFSKKGCSVLGVDGNYVDHSKIKIPMIRLSGQIWRNAQGNAELLGLTNRSFFVSLT